jgi:phage-related protein
LAQVNTLLEQSAPLLDQIGNSIATGLTTAINVAVPAFQFFQTVVKQALSGENLDAASVFLYALEDMGIKVPPIFEQIVFAVESGIYTVQTVLSGLAQVFQIAFTAVQTVVVTWLPIFIAAFSGITLFLQAHSAEIQLLIGTAWTTITTIYQTAITTIVTVINAFAPIVTAVFGAIGAFLAAHGSEIMATLTTAWQTIGEIVSNVAQIVQTVVTAVFSAVAGFIRAHGSEIQAVLSAAWTFIKGFIDTTLAVISGIVRTVLAVV